MGRPPAADFLGLTGLESLEPGAVRLAYFSLDPWFRFDKPGTYLVRAEQLEPGPTETRREQRPGPDGKQQTVVVAERTSVTVAQAEASMTVVPLDPQRLEARCQELFDTMRELRGGPLYQATGHALMSVRHDVALPYLEHMAMAPSRAACVAIRRVGTPRAEKLIQALAARNDGVGEAARQALDTSLEPPAPTPDTHLSR
ncbi:MAG: hypothetical protein FJX74_12030 [Armatimonadetes bacterium]|nr:hypothetical protein [Armatimonadota bacterium]